MVADSEIQRIAELTPLADVLASFDLAVGPVEPREEAVAAGVGLTLAADAVVAGRPPEGGARAARRLCRARRRDHRRQRLCAGAAVARPRSRSTPARRCRRGRRGAALRRGPDARRAGRGAAPPSRRAKACCRPAPTRRRAHAAAGRRAAAPDRRRAAARARDRARAGPPAARARRQASQGAVVDGAASLIASAINAESGLARTDAASLEAALQDVAADAVVAIGGTGSGRNDASVQHARAHRQRRVPRHRHRARRDHRARLRRPASGAAAARAHRRGARRLAHRRTAHAGAAGVPPDRGAAVRG